MIHSEGFMYETKINIFTKGLKKRFLGNFFVFFQKKYIRFVKKIFLKIVTFTNSIMY